MKRKKSLNGFLICGGRKNKSVLPVDFIFNMFYIINNKTKAGTRACEEQKNEILFSWC